MFVTNIQSKANIFNKFFTEQCKPRYLLQKPRKAKLYGFVFDKQLIKLSKQFVCFYWDFHKLVLTAFKTIFVKSKPKELSYRDYKDFNHGCFEKDLKCALSTSEKINYQEFDKTFIDILNKHVPMKKKLVRPNKAPCMTKALRKAIMRRSKLETKYFKLKTNDTLKAYKKQKNYCSRLHKKERRESVICC